MLEDISFAVEEGTTTVVLGRSGSGKTTLLRTVNRMVEPRSGDVLLRGQNVREPNPIALRRGMGYVIQENGLFPHMTALRNVGLVLEVMGIIMSPASSKVTVPMVGAPITSEAATRRRWVSSAIRPPPS